MPAIVAHEKVVVDGEEYDELPEMVIGTTELWPMVKAATALAPSADASPHDSTQDTDSKHLAEPEQVEYASEEPRRAKWQRHDGKWVVEGLE
jgi:hypothetical protein